MQKYTFQIPTYAQANEAEALKSTKLLHGPDKHSFAQEATNLLTHSPEVFALLRAIADGAKAHYPGPRSWKTSGPGVTTLPTAATGETGFAGRPELFLLNVSVMPTVTPDQGDTAIVILEMKIEINPEIDLEHKKYAALLCENARRMIHDLAQPVQAIYSFGASLVHALSKDEAAYPAKQAHWIRTSNDQTERLVALIKEHRAGYIAPKAMPIPSRPCWAIALLLAEFEARQREKAIIPIYHPLSQQEWVVVDLEKLLTCVALYLSILEEAAPNLNKGATAAFGFLPNPEAADIDGSKISFGFSFPFPDQTRSKWLQPTFDQQQKDFGFGHLALTRGLEELGTIKPRLQTGSTGLPPEFIGVLLNRQAQVS